MFRQLCKRSFSSRYFGKFEELKPNTMTYKTTFSKVRTAALIVTGSVLTTSLFAFKFNEESKQYNLFFFNNSLNKLVARRISIYFQQLFATEIYKEETEEVERVKGMLGLLAIPNQIRLPRGNIFVLRNNAYFCSLLENGDVFITDSLLEMCNDDELSFFIASELAFFYRGELPNRVWLAIKQRFTSAFAAFHHQNFDDSLNFMSNKLTTEKHSAWYLKLVNFYPESCITKTLNLKHFPTLKKIIATSVFNYKDVF